METCKESGWLTLHSSSIHSCCPCSLLPAEWEERTAEAWLPGRGYNSISVTQRRTTHWLTERCLLSWKPWDSVWWLELNGGGGFTSKSWCPRWKRCLNMRRKDEASLKVLGEVIWFKLNPWGMHLLLSVSPISPTPHPLQLHAFVSYFVQDVTHPLWCFNYAVSEKKKWERSLEDLAWWSFNNISLPLTIYCSTVEEKERRMLQRQTSRFCTELFSTVNLSISLV